MARLPLSRLLMFVLILAGTFAAAVRAQGICTSDVQCWRGGQPTHVECQGTTLVITRSTCAGYCRQMEITRQDCRIGGAVHCVGGAAQRLGGRCDIVRQGCAYDAPSLETCFKSCVCSKNRLIVATGQCTEGAGCGHFVRTCKAGCTCDGEPRCLDDAPRASRQR